MKNRAYSLILIFIFIFSIKPVFSVNYSYITRKCRFEKGGGERIYTIFCEKNCSITFILPIGETVSEVIEPTGEWRINSNGIRYVFVVPDRRRIHTSLDIITKQSAVYSFILREISGSQDKSEVTKKVLIVSKQNGSIFKLRTGVGAKKAGEKDSEGKRIYTGYKIKDKFFHIKSVYDDGRFTYIEMQKGEVRPALFLKKSRGKNNLETLRYTDNGTTYKVHRILNGKERLLFRIGKKESSVRRK